MKLSHKIGAALLAAASLALFSCADSFTEDADAAKASTASKIATDSSRTFTVSLPGSISWDAAENVVTEIELSFNAPVNRSTVANGILIKKISGTSAGSIFTETAIDKGEPFYSGNDKTVTFSVNLKDVYGILIEVNPEVISSSAGAKIDTDGDETRAEKEDDAKFKYYYASNTTPGSSLSYGQTDYNSDGLYIYDDGTYTQVLRGDERVMPSTSLLGSFSIISGNDGYYTAKFNETYGRNSKYYRISDTVLNANVKIQWFDRTSKSWKDVEGAKWYGTEAEFRVNEQEATKYRLYTSNVQALKSDSASEGYVRRFTLNQKEGARVLAERETSVSLENKNCISDVQFSNYLVDKEFVRDRNGDAKGYRIENIAFTLETDSSTYVTDNGYHTYNNYAPWGTLYVKKANGTFEPTEESTAALRNGTYYSSYSDSGKYVHYEFKELGASAAETAKKLHFFDANLNEVKASVTKSKYSDNKLIVVFDNTVTLPGSKLYVYADWDLSVVYSKTTWSYKANENDSADTYYDDYICTVKTEDVKFTAGKEYSLAKLITPYADRFGGKRLLAEISLYSSSGDYN